MKLTFYKYHGTGNDFIIVDNRNSLIDENSNSLFLKLCHRKFGIGADGLILIQNHEKYDFEMLYYNADGAKGSMCGNGARCTVAFLHSQNIIGSTTTFFAADGIHNASIHNNIVSLRMSDVDNIEVHEDFVFLNNGSPHYMKFVDNIHLVDVNNEGKAIRNNDRFKKEGTNVNFVQCFPNALFVRTYERGVENETLSCGTGVTASAIAAVAKKLVGDKSPYKIKTLGGELTVHLKQRAEKKFTDIYLEGTATFVFKGEIEL